MKRFLAVTGMIILSALAGLFVFNGAWGANRYIPAKWSETADSAKLFIYAANSSTIVDSSAGAARTNTTSYDTTVSLNLADSSYRVVVTIWYPGAAAGANWEFDFPREDNGFFEGELVVNGGFEADSVSGTTAPFGWTQGSGSWTSSEIATSASPVQGDWVYRNQASNTTGSFVLYQMVRDTAPAGLYLLSGDMYSANTGDLYLFVDDETPTSLTTKSGTIHRRATGTWEKRTDLIKFGGGPLYVGVQVDPNTIQLITHSFDNISLKFVGLDTSTYQGAASGLTAAEVADSVWQHDTTVSTAGSYGVLLKDTLAYQGSGSSLTAAEVVDSILAILPTDTNTGTWASELLRALDSIRDSIQYLVTGPSASIIADTVDSRLSASHGSGAWTGGSGGGANLVKIAATDTSGTDSTVSNVEITVRDLSGNLVGVPQVTNSGGYATFNLNADTFTVQVTSFIQNGHFWPASVDTFVVVTNPDSFGVAVSGDTLVAGYDITPTSTGTAATCVVWGIIYDAANNPVSNATVVAELKGRNLLDTNTANIIVPTLFGTTTNDTGYFEIELLRTSSFSAGGKYNFTASRNGLTFLSVRGYDVPDSASHRIRWDNR